MNYSIKDNRLDQSSNTPYTPEHSADDDLWLDFFAHPKYAELEAGFREVDDAISKVILAGRLTHEQYVFNAGQRQTLAVLLGYREHQTKQIEERRTPPDDS